MSVRPIWSRVSFVSAVLVTSVSDMSPSSCRCTVISPVLALFWLYLRALTLGAYIFTIVCLFEG